MNKPVIRVPSSGHRQFDVAFKMMIIRACAVAKRGDIQKILNEYQLNPARLSYWRKQFDQGHFTRNRAVAFSRQPTMIHG
tara:strand:+ start:573 stop:812 length:240 start_codon:yes stop_codon:yes gene_type:complete